MPHTTPLLNRRRTVLPALLLLLILLPACGQDATRPAQPDGPPRAAFHGLGQEPGWLLDIHPSGELRFAWDYGQRELVVPSPPPSWEPGARVYSSYTEHGPLEVRISEEPCHDVMSGKPFPATVKVRLDGQTYTGCGRQQQG